MADDDQYALCWNNFNKNLTAGFHSLYSRGHFTDVTLSAGGQLLKAHRMVLSVCSPYFQAMFESTPVTQHPIIFLKDITFKNLTDLVQFMYCGEVHVKQDELSGFIAIAESLQIKGLTESGESNSSPDNSKHDISASRPLRAAKRNRKRELEDIITTPAKVGKRTSTMALRQGKKLSTHSQDPLQQDVTSIPSTSTAEFIEMDALQTKTEPTSYDDQDMDSSYMQADDTYNPADLVEKDDNYEPTYSEAEDTHEEKESKEELNNTDTADETSKYMISRLKITFFPQVVQKFGYI